LYKQFVSKIENNKYLKHIKLHLFPIIHTLNYIANVIIVYTLLYNLNLYHLGIKNQTTILYLKKIMGRIKLNRPTFRNGSD